MSYVYHPFNYHIFWTQSWDMCFSENMWMCRNEGKGYLNWSFLIKSGMYGHFSRVTQQSADLKGDSQKLFTHGSELATCFFAECHLWGSSVSFLITLLWLHYYYHSANILSRVLKFVATFLFSFSTCPQLCFSFFERSGEMNPAIIIYQVVWSGKNIPEM